MNSSFLMIALGAISVFSSLLTQAIKKILDEQKIKYSANILVVIVSTCLTIASSVCYIVYTNTTVTPQIIIEILVLILLSFLSATLGYDKVLQAIAQIKGN